MLPCALFAPEHRAAARTHNGAAVAQLVRLPGVGKEYEGTLGWMTGKKYCDVCLLDGPTVAVEDKYLQKVAPPAREKAKKVVVTSAAAAAAAPAKKLPRFMRRRWCIRMIC